MKIVFLGTPHFAKIVLEKLIDSPYKPTLVITGQDQKHGRGQALMPTQVKLVTQKNGIEVSYGLSEIDDSFDLAILVAYGKIIPESILQKPKYGFLNVHPSLLPKYRGPSPIQSAILAGETKTGVTIMKLDQELDHGPIIDQTEIKVDTDDTHASLIEKLGFIGSKLLIEVLPKYLDGTLKPTIQNHTAATYTQKVEKNNGKIDINNPPDKKTLGLMIRAYFPWPTVWFKDNGKTFKILPNDKIQPEGKRPMTFDEFKNGYPKLKELIENLL